MSLDGRHEDALGIVEGILKQNPGDLEAVRLKGNILDLWTLQRAEYSPRKLLRYAEFQDARRCYESILLQDATNILALIDLGDHFKYLRAFDKAMDYYDRALALLRDGESRFSWPDEVNEAFEGKIDIELSKGKTKKADSLRQDRESFLAAHRPRRQ
jgi:tetratricopeptide (TPR) repeat protein